MKQTEISMTEDRLRNGPFRDIFAKIQFTLYELL